MKLLLVTVSLVAMLSAAGNTIDYCAQLCTFYSIFLFSTAAQGGVFCFEEIRNGLCGSFSRTADSPAACCSISGVRAFAVGLGGACSACPTSAGKLLQCTICV